MHHDLDDCPNFKEKSARDKKDFLFKAKMCFCCYSKDHLAEKCNSKRTCNECGESHPTGLHGVSFKVSAIHQDEGGAMCVVPVRLRHRTWKDREIETYALLDECSTGTFISESLSEVLEDTLKEKRTVMVHTVNRSDESEAFKVKDLIVRGSEEFGALYDLEDINLPATFSQESIPMEREDIQLPETVSKWEYLEKVASTLTGIKDIPMGLLIGTNCPKALEPIEVIPSQNNGPYATRRRLGWCVSAPVEERPGSVKCNRIRVCHTRITDISINKALQQMWENDFIEKSSERKTFSREDRTFLDQMKREISFSEGHYVLPLPLRIQSNNPKGDASQREEISLSKHGSDNNSEEKAGRVERRSEPGKKVNNRKKVKIVSPENLTEALKEAESDTDIVAMPKNKANVLNRLKWVKKRMMKDEGFCKEYCEFMKKLFKAGHARKVPKERLLERSWYIPHHGVYHPSKKKLRVVFDCSAELDGVSLNSMLLQGPDFMNSMLGVLVRFRIGLIPVMTDIEAMYYQVKIPEEHCKFLRFFWWEDGLLSREPVECEMCVHPFGAISSKNCVIFALHQTAYDNQNTFGNAAMKTLLQDFYVDDMLKADDDKDEIISLLRNIIGMCGEGGFNITKFVCPDSDVLNTIPEGKRSGDHGTHRAGSLMPAESALGVLWNLRDDTFGFYVSFSTDDGTRAGCLSTISKIHDPNGIAAPFILPGRKILQKMTAGSGSWSDKLSPEEAKDWERWKEDVLLLNQLKMRRCYKSPSFGHVVEYSLHCFSDASFVGYGVACYLRMVNAEGEVELSLVMGKARVSPLKPTTVPRLELTAATVSVKIAAMLIDELKLNELKVYYWVDSKIVLGYILNGKRRYRIYVANRKELINTYTEEDQWRHIDTEDNPSDFASRGISPRDSGKVERWLGGPLFLRQRDDAWKHLCPQVEIKEDDVEVKANMRVNAASLKVSSSVLDTLENRISSWHKMKRVMVWVSRFFSKKWRAEKIEEIKVAEIQQAENAIIKLMQERSYKKEITALRNLGRNKREKEPRKVNKNKKSVKGDRKADESKKVVKGLRKLDPFIDEDGIMRVGGRLAHADEEESFKSPVLIPKNSKATRALIRWHHRRTEHRGKHTTIGRLREVGFWIVNGSREVGSVVFKCVRCRWLRGKLNGQKMADLPWNRTTIAPPFTYCGVDVFGPVYVKEGRKVLKRYGLLFTCFSLRAVHIEMLASLETDSFIQALCRFISRRGAVREIRSDNGTNFVGAESELRDAMQEMDQAKIGGFLTEQGCDYILWERNAPKASHMGGVWERQIRTVKSVISSLVKSSPRRLDEESMRTFFTEAEAIVNSRPLTLESLHDPEMRPLTPNQILTMKTKVASPPPGVFQNEGVYSRKRWRVVQHLADSFWSRWRREYLQLLQARTKWTEEKRNLQVNDVVLMKDEDAPRGRWPMARVTETHPSKDGLVRSVTLSAKGSLFKRPVHKTVLLVAGDEDQEDAHSQ